MVKELTIECPHCNSVFSADEALQNHLKNKQSEIDKQLKNKEKEISQKIKSEFELKEKSLKQKIATEIEQKNLKEINDLKKQIVGAQKDKENFKNKLKDDFEKKQKTLEQKIKSDLEKNFESKNNKEIIKLQNELIKKDNEQKKKDKEREIENKRQEKRIDEMAKQIKQKSVEVQGEVQEELIQDFLRERFPEDDIEEIKKGARGADCVQTINHKDNRNLAQIYFESKDHKTFKEEWVSKLLNDMKEKNISFGILITTALPKDLDKQSGYALRHGKRIMIIPMNYQIIHLLVDFLRRNLIREFKSKKEFDAPKEMKKLWDHITGPGFQLPLRKLFQTIGGMGDLIEKEKRFYELNMAKKEKNLRDMEGDFRDLINSFASKVGNVLPENMLELENKNEEL